MVKIGKLGRSPGKKIQTGGSPRKKLEQEALQEIKIGTKGSPKKKPEALLEKMKPEALREKKKLEAN